MSDIHDRVAERIAMALATDADTYRIMAEHRVRALSGNEEPTIEHYRLALEKCIAEKAADWRAACESATAASKAVGDLKAEVERLRLTDAERAFFELHIERVRWWAHSSRESEAELATVSAMFARLGGDQCHE